jgi:hypothetical protein
VEKAIATGKALAITAKALEQPETEVRAAGAMLLAMVTAERKEIRFAPMRVRSVVARALGNGFRDRLEMRDALVGLRRSPRRLAVAIMVAVVAAVGVLVQVALAYWDQVAN